MKSTKFAQVAGIMLALTFAFSCSGGDDKDGGNDPNNGGTSSPSGCRGGTSGTFKDTRDGTTTTYKTTKICTQTWMAENLNYAVAGSKCGTDDFGLSDANTTFCDKYGRLYDWETAMTACPNGWHLPSLEEWEVLFTAVGGKETAGKYLKAKSGWEGDGNGEDTFGFSALPGGYSSGRSFGEFGDYGVWWSSSAESSRSLGMSRNYEYIHYGGSIDRGGLFSVRCVQ